MGGKPIKSALISVFHKKNLEPILDVLKVNGVTIYSTGGTQKFIEEKGLQVEAVEDQTGYPSIFGGRVKTLHPKVFGGILQRSENASDQKEAKEHAIPPYDMVIVDLYPFEETLAAGGSHDEVIEKIDIGGISLIRAGAKNYRDVLIVSSMSQYEEAHKIIETGCSTTLEERRKFATYAFQVSSHYDTSIFNYFNQSENIAAFRQSHNKAKSLRYGENPHQEGNFYGDFEKLFDHLHGKAISYNNLIDIDAAVALIGDLHGGIAFAILKHNNACGAAYGATVKEAYLKAFAADTQSAFGGILVTNTPLDLEAAEEINKLFCEVVIAPEYSEDALRLLKSKKNRIVLLHKQSVHSKKQFRSLLNGAIVQEIDTYQENESDLSVVTTQLPAPDEMETLLFANTLVKHTKSNAIVLATGNQMISSGVGQTSRIDAVRQAIEKARSFGFDVSESVMASDAFFPFKDSVEIANEFGIKTIIQPGGSVKDKESIDFCNEHQMSMVFTGKRHFRH